MSQQVADISTSTFVVGQTGSIPSAGTLPIPPPTLRQQMNPADDELLPTLVIFNESGCKLKLLLPETNQSLTLPAGRWVPIKVPPDEKVINYVVQDVASGIFNKIAADFYWPGEPIEPMGVLGNSPIGGTVNTSQASLLLAQGSGTAGVVVENFVGEQRMALSGYGTDEAIALAAFKQAGATDVEVFRGNADGSIALAKGQVTADSAGNVIAPSLTLTGARAAPAADPGLGFNSANHETEIATPQTGASAQGVTIITWDGAAQKLPLAIGSNGDGAKTVILHDGSVFQLAGIGTAGRYGVPFDAAQASDVAVTSSAQATILSFTAPSGNNAHIRINGNFWIGAGNTNNGTISMVTTYTDPINGATTLFMFAYNGAQLNTAVLTKGGPQTPLASLCLEVSASSTVTVKYTNGAAGTISDQVSVIAELMN